jgi:pseudaminic acid cytidylyltransferase
MPICLVPARSGSKRIPDKNVLIIRGKPMLHWPLSAAVQSGLFSRVLCSTDSLEYAEIAEEVPGVEAFLRSDATATDTAPLESVLVDGMQKYPGEAVWCLLLATAVEISAERLLEIFFTFEQGGFRALATVTRDSALPERTMYQDARGALVPFSRRGIRKRTQDCRTGYHDAGQCYFLRSAPFLWRWLVLGRDILLQRPMAYVLDHAVDIDTPADLKAALHA